MPRNVQLQSDTQFTTVYADEQHIHPMYTLHRRHAAQPASEPLWSVYPVSSAFPGKQPAMRGFRRTQFLVNWLIKCAQVRIDHRDIDEEIIAAIKWTNEA